MKSLRILLFAALAAPALIGCGTLAQPQNARPGATGQGEIKKITHGTITTEGMRIGAQDGSFELASTDSWMPPFHQGEQCLLDPTADNYGDALKAGAKKVRIEHPKLSEPLYGVLSFCGRVPGSKGAAARSYQLVVPDSYINQTSDGRATVIYEFHQFDSGAEQYNSYAEAQTKSWILWLSRVPLDVDGGLAGGRTVRKALGKQMHDGFFFRFSPGISYVGSSFESPDVDYSYSGGGYELRFALGSAVVEDVILHANLNIGGDSDPDYEIDKNRLDFEPTIPSPDYMRVMVGAGATYYLWENVYVTGAAGLSNTNGTASFQDNDPDTNDSDYSDYEDRFGAAIDLSAGKEWWVSDNWGLGASAGFSSYFSDASFGSTAFTLSASATYN